MKYSIVNELKVEAFPNGKGFCLCCNQPTVAKCGKIRINHWSHISLKHCDNWWENETEWHRKWKSFFPEEWQEIVHFDDETGEKHIADVKTDKGFILEFQNSPLSIEELESREKFYEKMLWIVNGLKFKNNFHILGNLPDPRDKNFHDIVFPSTKKNHLGRVFWKYSENPDWKHDKELTVLMHDFSKIEKQVQKSYIGHHLFDWIKPRTVWYKAKSDVLIDFGEDNLWKLLRYDNNGVLCVRKIKKDYFIRRALGQTPKSKNL